MKRLYDISDASACTELELSNEFSNLIDDFVEQKLASGLDIRDVELCLITTVSMKFVEKRLIRKAPGSFYDKQ